MCYPKPGPRCSGHSLQRWLRAEGLAETDPTPANRTAALQARDDHDATPQGLHHLAAASGDRTLPEQHRAELLGRHAAAINRRRAQVEAYQEVTGETPDLRTVDKHPPQEDQPELVARKPPRNRTVAGERLTASRNKDDEVDYTTDDGFKIKAVTGSIPYVVHSPFPGEYARYWNANGVRGRQPDEGTADNLVDAVATIRSVRDFRETGKAVAPRTTRKNKHAPAPYVRESFSPQEAEVAGYSVQVLRDKARAWKTDADRTADMAQTQAAYDAAVPGSDERRYQSMARDLFDLLPVRTG